MHLAFMTFATPDWGLEQLLAGAIRYGYDGVEPRTVCKHKHGLELGLTKAQRADVKSSFAACGVRLSAVATSLSYAFPDPAEVDRQVEATKKYLQLASDLGSPVLRVFGGQPPNDSLERPAVHEIVAGALSRCAPIAADCHVGIAVETHDYFSRAEDLVQVLQVVNHPRVGANWDFLHSLRYGESLEASYGYLQGRILHAHVHDATWPEDNPDDFTMVPMGTGSVPHLEAIRLMAAEPAEIALSLEWESSDRPEVVLPREAAMLRKYLAEAG